MVEFVKATYSYTAIKECRKKVLMTATTVRVKNQHPWKCYEIEKLFDECYDRTGCMNFDTRYGVWDEYRKLVNTKGSTKKEMDRALKACCRFLLRELDAIKKMMDDGEVNAIA